MNRQQLLLIQFSEELSEVQQAVSKALRFWLDDGYPGKNTTNAEDFLVEFEEAKEVLDMLFMDGLKELPYHKQRAARMRKNKRAEEYLNYSRNKGVLNDWMPGDLRRIGL